jgi:hypothetical protein
MSKFQKRILKAHQPVVNALVVGKGFGYLSDISDLFNSVFVVDNEPPELKARNIIFREGSSPLEPLTDISAAFFDLEHVNTFSNVKNVLSKNRPVIFVEGNDIIDRDTSLEIWKLGYRPLLQQGFFHTWKKIK